MAISYGVQNSGQKIFAVQSVDVGTLGLWLSRGLCPPDPRQRAVGPLDSPLFASRQEHFFMEWLLISVQQADFVSFWSAAKNNKLAHPT